MNMLFLIMYIRPEGGIMAAPAIRHKHLRLDQTKLHRVQSILGATSETEALEEAMNIVLAEEAILYRRPLIAVQGVGRRIRRAAATV
jgi:hypothetical protein